MKTVLILLSVFLLIGGGVFFGLKFLANQSTSVITPPTVQKALEGDVNRDGKIDALDEQFIKDSLNCKKGVACWTKVVGKTSDGDNPIYASDLDLNNDEVINDLDLSTK